MKINHCLAAAFAALCLCMPVAIAQSANLDPTRPAPVVQWVAAANGATIANAIIGGSESGRTLPVCRASFKNGVHPGKVVEKTCNFGYGGNEVTASQYEVLAGNPDVLTPKPQLVRWTEAPGGKLPPGALVGAFEPGAAVLLICRAPYKGGVHIGKVYAGSCYFGYGGREVPSPQYAVLVVGPALQSDPVSIPALGELEARRSNLGAALVSLRAEPSVNGSNADLNAQRISMEATTTETLAKLDAWLTRARAEAATADKERFKSDAAAYLDSLATNQAELQNLIWEIVKIDLKSPSR